MQKQDSVHSQQREICAFVCGLLCRLLRNDLPTGGEEPHLVRLNKGLGILGEPLKEGQEVGGQNAHLGQGLQQVARRHEECIRLLDQGVLVAPQARVLVHQDLEACPLQRIGEV